MGKNLERQHGNEFDDEAVRDVINEIEYSLNDEEFFKQFEPKKTRKRKKGARHARRRIDEYWEDRILAERLTEYYDDPNE